MATGTFTGTPAESPSLGTPIILTDTIFTEYGGATGTSTVAQRQAAYLIAEGAAVTEVGTFVAPTITTGTYMWPPMNQPVKIEHDHLMRVISLTSIHEAGCECADTSIELTGCAWIMDADNGVLGIREVGNTVRAACSACNCQGASTWGYGVPYQFRIVYEAGLSIATAADPRLLLGLVTWADLALEQMIDPSGAEGGPGDPGVKQFSAQGYSEQRIGLTMTAMGPSARANYGARHLANFKERGALKLGW